MYFDEQDFSSAKNNSGLQVKDEPTFGSRYELSSKQEKQTKQHRRTASNNLDVLGKNANNTGNFGFKNQILHFKNILDDDKKFNEEGSIESRNQLIYESAQFNEATTDRYRIRETSHDDKDKLQLSEEHIRGYLIGRKSTISKMSPRKNIDKHRTQEDIESQEQVLTQTERLIRMENRKSTTIILDNTSDKKNYNYMKESPLVNKKSNLAVLSNEKNSTPVRLQLSAGDFINSQSKYTVSSRLDVEKTINTSYGSRIFQKRDIDSYTKQYQQLEDNPHNTKQQINVQYNNNHELLKKWPIKKEAGFYDENDYYDNDDGDEYSNLFSTPPPNKYSSERAYLNAQNINPARSRSINKYEQYQQQNFRKIDKIHDYQDDKENNSYYANQQPTDIRFKHAQ